MTIVTVGKLWQYPVKSMQGREVDEILSAPAELPAIAHTDSSTSRPAGWPAPSDPDASVRCWTATPGFLLHPSYDGDSPPVEVTFPDGTVVRTDDDGGAELTRQVARALWVARSTSISTAPEGIALDELIPQIEGLGENALEAMQTEPADSHGDRFIADPGGDGRARHDCWTWPPCTSWPPAPCAGMADAHPDGDLGPASHAARTS